MRHHTKDKGDCGVGFVMSNLLSRGIQVAILISEHLPFDMIAISESGELRKISVKYRAAKKDVITIVRCSVWSNKSGPHSRIHARGSYDAVAVYCPNSNRCYYVREEEIIGVAFSMRLSKSRNGQKARVRNASEYEDPTRIFG